MILTEINFGIGHVGLCVATILAKRLSERLESRHGGFP